MLSIHDLRLPYVSPASAGPWNLELPSGSALGVAGSSGCGKTTLLRTVCGLISPVTGRVLLNSKSGDDIGWPTFRRQVLFVQQRPQLCGPTVRDDLERPHRFRSASANRFDAGKAQDLMESVSLSRALFSGPVSTLSEGQAQRVALIRSLLCEPSILLLDEPTASLDGDSAGRARTLIKDFCAKPGHAAIIVSHDLILLDSICSEQISMTAEGAPA